MIDIPRETVIRRYIPVKYLETILNGELYFTQFDKFPDRLEGGIAANNFSSISNSWGVLDRAINRNWPSVESDRSEIAEVPEKKEYFPSLFGPQHRDNGEAYLKNIRYWLYASCWIDLPHECYAMWQLFGSSGANCTHPTPCQVCYESLGQSVCIESTVGALLDNLDLPKGYSLLARKIEYLDQGAHTFEEHELADKPFFTKASHYSFEHEYRFLVWPTDKDIRFSYKHESTGVGSTKNDQDHLRVSVNNIDSVIHKIILSPLPPAQQLAIQADHMKKYKSALGLQESLSNTPLRDKVEEMCRKYQISSKIVDSALNQVPATDCYSAVR
ncbi:hypothetical protein [Pseudomonas sp. zfem002]|uniref:hypothetical protein n=1 Tax=Pseudomonas sp. zfem002 TaxID=3078197 RepID=UPI002927D33C|nr:hypothetical protein [Pseudomonas sp. zfem002]MDU9394714.1 hypothetical protein [Pseudomonas sp. zfem002]